MRLTSSFSSAGTVWNAICAERSLGTMDIAWLGRRPLMATPVAVLSSARLPVARRLRVGRVEHRLRDVI